MIKIYFNRVYNNSDSFRKFISLFNYCTVYIIMYNNLRFFFGMKFFSEKRER